MKHLSIRIFAISALLFITGCATKPQSDVDSPEYHFRSGMRSVDTGNYDAALNSFQRALDLDKKFVSGYAGLGLANAHLGNTKAAKKNIGKAVDKGSKDPDVLAICGRAWIVLRKDEKKWFKQATKILDKALKRDKQHEASMYYYGLAHLYKYNFSDAESYFRKVVELKGDFSGKADAQWKRSQKIVRAMPGTEAGKKIALQEQINRADLSVIFAEELKISELMAKLPSQSGGFQTPGQMNTTSRSQKPSDASGHWASSWINEVLQYGILEVGPDGRFYPDETITRAEYAMAVQRLLVVATRDNDLEVRYFGENPSRFSDVPSSHPAYNAMALCSERGIMQSDVMTGKFNPSGKIDGADALLIIRTLQNSLRMTF
ncbi:S-layer homology domain-containing protein [Candidatus Marinimicrobia bacterium]|nr:S-layer homology domain-containing protein [Candidatus Neomarinimicrobiota bacterium]RZP30559.1 MAG: tetratricopeptide repeat protein [bacterium]|tara:strand:+ start:1744 stop:2868 length:1125 start_codon:yes stop_codon:yes gene_type:complete